MDVRERARRMAPDQASTPMSGPTSNYGLMTVDANDLREQLVGFVRAVWRRKAILIAAILIVPALAYWLISNVTPLYSATAQVMVSGRQQNALAIQEVVSMTGQDLEAVASQIEVIRSRAAAEAVVERLRLDEAPGPAPGLLYVGVPAPEPSFFEQAYDWAMSWTKPKPQSRAVSKSTRKSNDWIVDHVLSQLWVAPAGRSYVVNIGYTSTDPVIAANIANAFAQVYLEHQEEMRAQTAGTAHEWLGKQIQDMQAQVQAAETAIEEFRARADLMSGRDTPLSAQELSELNSQLTMARADQAQAHARLSEAERVANGNGDLSGLTDVLSSGLIQNLRGQELEVRRKLADLSETYGPRHPDIQRLQAELSDVREAIGLEVQKIVQGLRAEARVADVRVATLEDELASAKNQVAGTSDSMVRLRALEREAEASRRLLESFLVRSQELSAQQGFRQANAIIVSSANAPNSPSYPKTTPMMVLSVVAAIAIGLIIIAMLEMFDGSFRSGEQLSRKTGLPCLGLIPSVPRRKVGKSLAHYLRSNNRSMYAEGVRKTYAALSQPGMLPQSIAVTSTYPGEGKTSTALSLAVFAASLGQRVAIVDFDIRRPTVQQSLGLQKGPGLLEVLRGECGLEDVLEIEPEFGISVLGAGQGDNFADLLDARRIRTLLRLLHQDHDLVVFDTAPALAVADTRMICQQVEGVVFAVRWATTPRRAVQGALDQLDLSDKSVAGVLLTRVNTAKHAAYGFQDSAYYHRSLQRYYQS